MKIVYKEINHGKNSFTQVRTPLTVCNSVLPLKLKKIFVVSLITKLEKAMAPHSSNSCLENPIDGGAWWAEVHRVAKSQTRLSDSTFTFHFHALEKEMATHSSVLAWRIPGTGKLVGCCLWGRTESDTTEVT